LKEKRLNVLKPSSIAHEQNRVEEKTANPAKTEKSEEDAKDDLLETTR
jgi:hypothetical protein